MTNSISPIDVYKMEQWRIRWEKDKLAIDAYEKAQWRIRWAKAATDLDLRGLGLTAVPPELWELTGLEGLRLDGNQLTTIPPEIGQLTALTGLGLSKGRSS